MIKFEIEMFVGVLIRYFDGNIVLNVGKIRKYYYIYIKTVQLSGKLFVLFLPLCFANYCFILFIK